MAGVIVHPGQEYILNDGRRVRAITYVLTVESDGWLVWEIGTRRVERFLVKPTDFSHTAEE